ncbi:hypothetical protein LTR28_001389, partial [Elasticomyces elasticus]
SGGSSGEDQYDSSSTIPTTYLAPIALLSLDEERQQALKLYPDLADEQDLVSAVQQGMDEVDRFSDMIQTQGRPSVENIRRLVEMTRKVLWTKALLPQADAHTYARRVHRQQGILNCQECDDRLDVLEMAMQLE